MPFQVKTDLTPIQTAIRDAIPERITEAEPVTPPSPSLRRKEPRW